MSNSSRSSRIIISLSALLIALFFFLSIDRYKLSYEEWVYKLTQVKLASQELGRAILKVRGGLRIDYDQVAEKGAWLNDLSSSLGDKEVHRLDTAGISLFDVGVGFNQRYIELPVDQAVSLIAQRTELVENFKSNFSVLRNSQLIIFQLINDMRSQYADNAAFIDDLNSLERIVLHVMQFPDDRYREDLENQLGSIQRKYSDLDSLDAGQFINFVVNHFNMIKLREAIMEDLLQKEVNLVEQLDAELQSLEQTLMDIHMKEGHRAVNFSYAFVFVAVSVLVFGAIQSRRSNTLAKKLIHQNENLESLVNQRTEHLESAKDKLQKEKQEREEILVELDESRRKLDALINNINGCVYEYDLVEKKFIYISRGVKDIWGLSVDEVIKKRSLRSTVHPDDLEAHDEKFDVLIKNFETVNLEYRIVRADGEVAWVREMGSPVHIDGKVHSVVSMIVDVTEYKKAGEDRKRIEDELVHAQKLESVGQLAAGVAHEINTPAQFISDNLLFLQESVDDILQLIKDLESRVKATEISDLTTAMDELLEQADMEYLVEEVPPALKQSYEGISRIAKIVRAMKDYSHPGDTMEFSDINAALESTIIVSRTEWKYFAILETDFEEDLPMVECVVGDVNQVVLNMIVNAAHAIVDKYDDPDKLEGRITISTRSIDDCVSIEIADNGNGMPESVRNRIFDQFFTTKEVGRGTGQGLSIAYRLIVGVHGGKIEVDSEVGVGTTFRIILPIKHSKAGETEAADMELC